MERFVDDGTRVLDFLGEYYLTCPKCGGVAHVSVKGKPRFILMAPRRLSCAACGLSKKWEDNYLACTSLDEGHDWYFRLPFYFQKRCAGHTLSVANRKHLDFLRQYVAARHRTRKRDELGWKNRSMASRFPKWISDAKNRATILSALDLLEEKMNMLASTS